MPEPSTIPDAAPLLALSPLDGRYAHAASPLRAYLSETALLRERVRVELTWLQALSDAGLPEFAALTPGARGFLDDLLQRFDVACAAEIKAIERRTNHDVKAVEYWLKERVRDQPELARACEFIHFACTSEDINNVAYALMLRDARDQVLVPRLRGLEATLRRMAGALADQPMLSRTHGQTASPTTLGKELANVAARLARAVDAFSGVRLRAKMNGAVGNYNAHGVAYPDCDWQALARDVVESRLGLAFNAYTIQIEPHDCLAELFDALARVHVVLLDFARDVWGYVAFGYFKQRVKADEVGSSAMPHKVNPIDFENAEGNLGVANALLRHFSDKLPISRFQRDLSDSTVLRNVGVACGHGLVAYEALARGLGKLEVHPERLEADLDQAWEVLAEPIQTVMRRYGLPEPYERLKAFSRGQPMTRERLHAFIATLELPPQQKARLLALTPRDYTGRAAELARRVADGDA
jgi:adenylosuccinate lyase